MRIVYILAAILIFSVLIAIHELGHFVAAKCSGVRVNEFSIGMGPCLWHHQWGETQYSLRALPIGGFCAMEGEDQDTGDARSFARQNPWKKLAILAAGPLMNFLTGIVIILVLFSGGAGFNVDCVAGLAPEFQQTGETGLMPGDRVYKVNGYRAYLRGDSSLFLNYAGDFADIEVVRGGEHIVVRDIPKQTCTAQNGESYQGFGIYVGVEVIPATFLTRLQYSWYQTADFVQLVWFSLGELVSGGAGIDDISGPVGIVSTISDVGTSAATAADAWSGIFYLAALIAVNLAVMNLIPFPALDGGRILFLLVDGLALLLFHRRVPEKWQAAVNIAGLVLLMGFMLVITAQDVWKLFR